MCVTNINAASTAVACAICIISTVEPLYKDTDLIRTVIKVPSYIEMYTKLPLKIRTPLIRRLLAVLRVSVFVLLDSVWC